MFKQKKETQTESFWNEKQLGIPSHFWLSTQEGGWGSTFALNPQRRKAWLTNWQFLSSYFCISYRKGFPHCAVSVTWSFSHCWEQKQAVGLLPINQFGTSYLLGIEKEFFYLSSWLACGWKFESFRNFILFIYLQICMYCLSVSKRHTQSSLQSNIQATRNKTNRNTI